MLRRTLGETVGIETDWDPDVWHIHADAGQMENALVNLAINARDAMPDGGMLTFAIANATRDAVPDFVDAGEDGEDGDIDYVRVMVRDTGTGMSADVLQHVFEPFFTTKDVGKGSGLGLSMVYGFVRQSNGRVRIESSEGQGTAVTLFMPRAAPRTQSMSPPEVGGEFMGHGETVLVLEDDPDVRALTVIFLHAFGYRTLEAADAVAARTLLGGGEEIDLILSDVTLPGGLSGPGLVREADCERRGIKVLFMSGHANEDAAPGLKDAGGQQRLLRNHSPAVTWPRRCEPRSTTDRPAIIRSIDMTTPPRIFRAPPGRGSVPAVTGEGPDRGRTGVVPFLPRRNKSLRGAAKRRNSVASQGAGGVGSVKGFEAVAKASSATDGPVRIKKYANRRLYNTQTSSYVTLEQLADMVREGVDFVVVDAKSEDDLTRSVLTQIIVEQENKGENLLPIGFLRQLIGCYGDGLQSMLPNYLDVTMKTFTENQQRMREEMTEALDGVFPVRQFDELGRQNLALFEQAMRMFQPQTPSRPEPEPEEEAPPAAADEGELAALRRQLFEMQRQIDRLGDKNGAG